MFDITKATPEQVASYEAYLGRHGLSYDDEPERTVEWITNSNGVRKAVVVIGDYRLTLTERRYPTSGYAADRREFYQTTRVYGAIDALVPEFAADEPFTGIFIPHQPESELDKMRAAVWRTWKKATTKEAASRLSGLLEELSEFGGISVPLAAMTEVRFSQKAGCTTCPCSPGFVLGDRVRSADRNGVDIWVEKISA